MAPRNASSKQSNYNDSDADMSAESADEYIHSDDESTQQRSKPAKTKSQPPSKRNNTVKINKTNAAKPSKASDRYNNEVVDDLVTDSHIDSTLLSLDTVVDLTQIPVPCSVDQLNTQRQHNTYNGRPTRMIITKMDLYNFKSYAGTITIGPFHPCFTSIVGPNGSGKSNVIDALLFVFGKRAAAMRLKKVSDLIHRSAKHTNLQQCSVTVYFTDIIDHPEQGVNDLSFTVVPNTELVIKRVADQSSTTTYYVNDHRSTWSDVTALFKSKGVDLDNNRFLILQGEVEAIAMMKAKSPPPTIGSNGQVVHSTDTGLLEFLDEIIGTNRYSEALSKTMEYMEVLNYQRNERLNRLKHIESDCLSLVQPYHDALKFQYYQLQCNKLKIQQKQYAAHKVRSGMADAEAQLVKKKAELSVLKEDSAADEVAERDCKKQLKQLSAQKRDGEAERDEVKAAYEKTVSVESKHSEMERGLETTKQKLTSKHDKLVKQEQTLEKAIQSATDALPQHESKLSQLQTQLVDAEQYYAQLYDMLRDKTEKYQIDLEEQKKLLIPYKSKANSIQQQIDVSNNEISEIEQRVQASASQRSQLDADIESTSNKISKLEIQINSSKQTAQQCQSDITTAKQQLSEITDTEADLNKQRVRLLQSMEETRSASQQSEQSNSVVDQLMKCQRNKTITGIYGRLGDLATIDSKYDVAVSTACPSLNNIVVDSAATASKCVTYLKANKIGRATFICLDKQTGMEAKMAVKQTPDNTPRLFDLIKCDNTELMPAFYYAMKDTLVTDTLENATRIAFQSQSQRWRVVTVGGNIVDIAGTMSGGGAKPIKGMMTGKLAQANKKGNNGVRVKNEGESGELSPADVQRQIDAVESQLRDAQQQKQRFDAQAKQFSKQLSDAELAVKKQTIELGELKHTLTALNKRLASVNKSSDGLTGDESAQISKLRNDVKQCEKQLLTNNEQCETIDARVAELLDSIQQAGGGKLIQQQRIVDAYKHDVEETEKSINKVQHSIQADNKKLQKLQASDKSELLGEIQEAEQQLSKVQQERSVNLKRQNELEAELNALSKKMIKWNTEYESMEVQHTKLVTALEQKRAAYEQLEGEITELDTQLHAGRVHIQTYDQQINALNGEIAEETERADKYILTDVSADVYKLEQYTELTDDEVSQLDIDSVNDEWTMWRKRMDDDKLRADQRSIDEYHKKHVEYMERIRLLDGVTHLRDECRQMYEGMKKRRCSEFMVGFNQISLRLKEMYQMLTLGGDAELELVDTLDPYTEGVLFSVRPPKKSWKQIGNLSGGEKTLSSLALVFALHTYKPTPLYVMDEIDAALDFRNVSIVGNYLTERTKDAQFIVISLRNNMFELADRLVGIYKTDNTTKSVTIDPKNKLHMPQAIPQRQPSGGGVAQVQPTVLRDTTNTAVAV